MMLTKTSPTPLLHTSCTVPNKAETILYELDLFADL